MWGGLGEMQSLLQTYDFLFIKSTSTPLASGFLFRSVIY